MRLLEIEIRRWRGLDAQLSGLSPRLNLILGPNESGKSRIFQAIRYGLFESHKGIAQHKQLLQSWNSAECPWVRLVFSHDDVEYELQKQFLKGALAQLAGGGATHRGEDAEEALRGLVGARQTGSRGAGSAHLGIWPLLMVSQGDSRKAVHDDFNDDSRGRLQERLSQEIGIATISAAGQRLMALAREEHDRYFTANGHEGRALRDARATVDAAEHELAESSEALRRQEHTATELADNRLEFAALEARAQQAHGEAEAARVRAAAAQAAGNRVQVAQGAVNTVVQRVSNAQESLDTRLEADAAIERLANGLAQDEAQLRQRSSAQLEQDGAIEARDAQLAAAEVVVRKARGAIDTRQRERHREELATAHGDVRAKLAELTRLDEAIAAARATRASLPAIDDGCLGHLKTLDQNARAAAAKLQGAAVTVMVHLRQAAAVDGTQHAAGERVQFDVTENRRIAIGEWADIDIRPGGGELERLREGRSQTDSALAEALRAVDATDLEHAAAMHAQRTGCGQQISVLEQQISSISTKSVGQLREDLATLEAQLARLGTQDEQAASGTPGAPDAPDAQGQDEAALRAALVTAEASLTQARSARDSAAAARVGFSTETATINARAMITRSEHDRLASLYSNRPAAAALRAALEAVNAEHDRAQTELTVAQGAFSRLGGDEIQEDARRLGQASTKLVTRLRDVRSAGDQLQGALQSMMAIGHFETKEAAQAHAEHARNELSRLERQAAAAKRLWEVLSEERRRVVERLTAPVTLRVKPYLQELFPGSTLDAGEGLDIAGLQSGDLKEPFGELSGGAQEQISLLTRIGLAELLAGDGTLPLILDDALINTDPQRIQRVHRVLFRAANSLQVVLFSCHDVLFDGLGAEVVVKLQKQRQACV